jgi:Flp pilus assembly protein TadB
VSKARAQARAERAEAARRADERRRAEAERSASVRARQRRRALRWRRVRLWQHGPGFSRRREAVGALAAVVLVLCVATYVITRSATDVLVLGLVLLVGAPVLALIFFDRRRS